MWLDHLRAFQYNRRSCQSVHVRYEQWRRSVVSDATLRDPGFARCSKPGTAAFRSPTWHATLQLLEHVEQVHLPWHRSRRRGGAAKHQERRAVGRHID